jgi:hypothetical protein
MLVLATGSAGETIQSWVQFIENRPILLSGAWLSCFIGHCWSGNSRVSSMMLKGWGRCDAVTNCMVIHEIVGVNLLTSDRYVYMQRRCLPKCG